MIKKIENEECFIKHIKKLRMSLKFREQQI